MLREDRFKVWAEASVRGGGRRPGRGDGGQAGQSPTYEDCIFGLFVFCGHYWLDSTCCSSQTASNMVLVLQTAGLALSESVRVQCAYIDEYEAQCMRNWTVMLIIYLSFKL